MNGWWDIGGGRAPVAVFGAGGGVGSATVRLLRAQSVPLLLFDLEGESLRALAVETRCPAYTLDFREPVSIDRAVTLARETTPSVAGLVLCGGIVDTGKLSSLSVERWEEVMLVNLTATFLVMKAAADWVADGGSIVTMSSLSARTGGVITGTAYAASKAGVEAMTKSVAQELAPRRVRVNCVSPGAIDTPMTASHPPEQKRGYDAATPLKRHGTAPEVAAAACFLLSDGASYVTGQVLPVNGGVRMD